MELASFIEVHFIGGVDSSVRGRSIQDLPRKGVDISQRSSIIHFVSLYGFSTSDHGSMGMLFSMLMCYNDYTMKLEDMMPTQDIAISLTKATH